MNDLVSMLSEQNLGVNLASDIINCLLFADDIVLMGKSEQELQTLLNITARFASKWNIYPIHHFSILGQINHPAKLCQKL
jgi:hypothetical protein